MAHPVPTKISYGYNWKLCVGHYNRQEISWMLATSTLMYLQSGDREDWHYELHVYVYTICAQQLTKAWSTL